MTGRRAPLPPPQPSAGTCLRIHAGHPLFADVKARNYGSRQSPERQDDSLVEDSLVGQGSLARWENRPAVSGKHQVGGAWVTARASFHFPGLRPQWAPLLLWACFPAGETRGAEPGERQPRHPMWAAPTARPRQKKTHFQHVLRKGQTSCVWILTWHRWAVPYHPHGPTLGTAAP